MPAFSRSPTAPLSFGTYFGTKAELDAFGLDHRFPGSTDSSAIEFVNWLGKFVLLQVSFSLQNLISASGIDNLQYHSSAVFTLHLDLFYIELEFEVGIHDE